MACSKVLKGFFCPDCKVPFDLHTTRKPAAGLVVRYYRCLTCPQRDVTEERKAKNRRPRLSHR
jgi:hypothetical protein